MPVTDPSSTASNCATPPPSPTRLPSHDGGGLGKGSGGWGRRWLLQGAIALLIALLLLMVFPQTVHADVDADVDTYIDIDIDMVDTEVVIDPAAALPATLPTAELFELNCAGCHPHGGNIIRRGKTLKLRSLRRHHVDSIDAIATLITQGKNAMSAYGDRLRPDEIQDLAVYVWQQAEAGWPR